MCTMWRPTAAAADLSSRKSRSSGGLVLIENSPLRTRKFPKSQAAPKQLSRQFSKQWLKTDRSISCLIASKECTYIGWKIYATGAYRAKSGLGTAFHRGLRTARSKYK